MTGLTDALMDSVPVVCLTGQVPTHLIGNDAFQEADTTGITRPCTKHNYLVKNVADLAARRCTRRSMSRAAAGPARWWSTCRRTCCSRTATYSGPEQGQHKSYRPQLKGDPARIEEAVELMAEAKRPLFYGGGGVINSGPEACARFTELVRLAGSPAP